jgi:hypothetical protein
MFLNGGLNLKLEEFCEGIKLNSDARHILYNFSMDDKLYESYKKSFYNDRYSFSDEVRRKKNYRQLFLYLFVRFAVDAYEEYRVRDISDDIYFDTFSDIDIWCLNCMRDFGECGIEEYGWLPEHVQLRLFRLGRLQFQPYPFDCDLELKNKKIFKNQIVLNVHIPQGEPLDNEKVEQSFELARYFFRGIEPVFVCHSWLLFPQLSEILKPDSNILKFQKQFYIYGIDIDSRQAEERIFNKISDDFSQYGENTSLRRSAKTYLISGNRLGAGYGIKV